MGDGRGKADGVTLNRFQRSVVAWLSEAFGTRRAGDRVERTHRALEEALELAQACGCREEEAHELVSYVFSRPAGTVEEEIGGVLVTTAALGAAFGVDVGRSAQDELERIWVRIAEIRTKAAARRLGSPLPE